MRASKSKPVQPSISYRSLISLLRSCSSTLVAWNGSARSAPILWLRTASARAVGGGGEEDERQRERLAAAAAAAVEEDKGRTDVDDDAVVLERLDAAEELVLGAPLGRLAALLVELAEIPQVVGRVADRVGRVALGRGRQPHGRDAHVAELLGLGLHVLVVDAAAGAVPLEALEHRVVGRALLVVALAERASVGTPVLGAVARSGRGLVDGHGEGADVELRAGKESQLLLCTQ